MTREYKSLDTRATKVASLHETPFTREDLIRHYAEIRKAKGHPELANALAYHDSRNAGAERHQAWQAVKAHDFTPLDEYFIIADEERLVYVGRDRRTAWAQYDALGRTWRKPSAWWVEK